MTTLAKTIAVLFLLLACSGCWSDKWANAPGTSDGGAAQAWKNLQSQTNPPPLPANPSSTTQKTMSAELNTNGPIIPSRLTITSSSEQVFPVFFRSSNQWVQVSSDLLTWCNLSQLKSDVALTWDANSYDAGYKVYWGTVSEAYTNSLDVGTNNYATVSRLIEGTTYYFTATAYDGGGLESAYCPEISYTVPILAPKFTNPKQ